MDNPYCDLGIWYWAWIEWSAFFHHLRPKSLWAVMADHETQDCLIECLEVGTPPVRVGPICGPDF